MQADGSAQLKSRLSRALFDLNVKLASESSGALVQASALGCSNGKHRLAAV
jgi:hypothetical protein